MTPISLHNNRARGGLVLAAALLAQGILLVMLFATERTAPILTAAALAFVLWRWWRRGRLHPVLRVAVVTAALGGLGMLAGSWIDAAHGNAGSSAVLDAERGGSAGPIVSPCHAPPRTAEATPEGGHAEHGAHDLRTMAASWMFGLMLVACVAGCAWLCDDCGHSRRARAVDHLACAVGMVVGMVLGGDSAALLTSWSGLGSGITMHLGMVLGMATGAAAACAALRAARRRLKILVGR